MLHHRLLTPSRYSRPSTSISVQPEPRWISSGSCSAICVNGCQTWSLSQRFRSSNETGTCRLPFHDDFFFQRHAQHGFRAVAHNCQLQISTGAENGHERTGLLLMVGGVNADRLVLVTDDLDAVAGR